MRANPPPRLRAWVGVELSRVEWGGVRLVGVYLRVMVFLHSLAPTPPRLHPWKNVVHRVCASRCLRETGCEFLDSLL